MLIIEEKSASFSSILERSLLSSGVGRALRNSSFVLWNASL